MSIHYSLSHRIKNLSSNLSLSAKTLWTNPDDPAQPRIIRHFRAKPYWVNPDDPTPLRIIQTLRSSDDPDLPRIIRPLRPNLSSHVRMIRPYLGSSGPDIFSIYRAGGGGALTMLIHSLPPPPLSSKPRTAIWHFDRDFFVVSCAFDSPRLGRSGHLRNSFDSRGNLKGISFKVSSPRSLNVGSSKWFPPVNHLLYLSRVHA